MTDVCVRGTIKTGERMEPRARLSGTFPRGYCAVARSSAVNTTARYGERTLGTLGTLGEKSYTCSAVAPKMHRCPRGSNGNNSHRNLVG